MLQSLFCLKIALHVSGIIITHLQEHKTTVNTASGHVITMETSLRNKAQVNKTHYFSWPQTSCLRQQPNERKNRSTRHPQHTQISSNSSTIATDNSTNMYVIHFSIEHIAFSAEYTIVILI